MKRVAQFFKVSEENFVDAMREEFPQYTEDDIRDMYESLLMPRRAARGMIFSLLFLFRCRLRQPSRYPRVSG